MRIISDLELHSKYSRAVSPSMVLSEIDKWANKKGIGLVGSGDFTHPMWFRELEANLKEVGDGIYKFKGSKTGVRFLMTSEVSCIYKFKDKGRRVHMMVYLQNLSKVKQFSKELTVRGANLFSDGRPIIGLTLAQVAEIALSVDPKAIIIPAHVWTPWYGYYGRMSGFDSLNEAFGSLVKYIYAIETGLSSDPAMNWRIQELEGRSIVSFGDAHSPTKLGREATVFDLSKISFENIRKAIMGDEKEKIAFTIEFYPEEGKYHYTGHRKCNIVYSAKQTRKKGLICPVCGKKLTAGVLYRVEELAGQDIELENDIDGFGVRWVKDKQQRRPPYVMLIPLLELISESLGVGVGSKSVLEVYEKLVNTLASEFDILLKTPIEDISGVGGSKVGEAVRKMRLGDIAIRPGYDGVFGKVKIWAEKEKEDTAIDQGSLF